MFNSLFARITPRLRPYLVYRLYFTIPFWTASLAIWNHDHLCEVLEVTGESMSPTISADYHETGQADYILVQKWHPTLHMRRGDVVVFTAPLKGCPLVVKRVIALEGDLVWPDGERLAPLEGDDQGSDAKMKANMRSMIWGVEEEGVDTLGIERQKGSIRIPPGHVWVEGDNWRATRDSNFYGPISRGLIEGRALFLVWPFARIGERPWEEKREGRTTRVEESEFGPELRFWEVD